MKKVMLFLASIIVALASFASTAIAHQSEYSICATKRGGKTYVLDPFGTNKGWRTECRLGDTLIQQREVIRTATCSLSLEGLFPIVRCDCETGEVAEFSHVTSTTPADLVYDLQNMDVSVWMPNLSPPDQYLLFFASGNAPGNIQIEYTCTSH